MGRITPQCSTPADCVHAIKDTKWTACNGELFDRERDRRYEGRGQNTKIQSKQKKVGFVELRYWFAYFALLSDYVMGDDGRPFVQSNN